MRFRRKAFVPTRIAITAFFRTLITQVSEASKEKAKKTTH
jgi:hypothetical protein